MAFAAPAVAMEPVDVMIDGDRVDITRQSDFYRDRGDRLQVETAKGGDGISARMAVRASTPGTNPRWVVFALRNTGDTAVERWLVAERYRLIGSGVIWPDLDARRIDRITPSLGFVPGRIENDQADIFSITLEAGQTVTYVAEITSDRFPRLALWKPLGYQNKQKELTLFQGIMLGITVLLAIFLSAIFVANHKAIFPMAAAVAWSVLAYLCIDFGFWHKLFDVTAADNAYYRAAAEAAIAASMVLFLYAFLRVGVWHSWIRAVFGLWIVAQLVLVAAAVLDPGLAASLARTSFAAVGGLGSMTILYLALRGQDRALALVPTWLLFLVWLFGASLAVFGKLSGDVAVYGLVAGLVLILMMLGFTVTQFAFRSMEPVYGEAPSQLQLRSLAIDGAGSAVWEWNARRDEIAVSPVVEQVLDLKEGELNGSVDHWAQYLHPGDQERFRLVLQGLQEKGEGQLQMDIRLRRPDSTYRWFELEAASVPSSERRTLRCVGLMRDITDQKRSQERLIHDAVHDSLTGLPNRELFIDRLGCVVARVAGGAERPTVMFIDIDRFKNVNSAFGLIVGDSMLLTIARRLARYLGPQDTLARIGGDQFAILLTEGHEPREIAMLAERIRRSLRSPMKIAGKEIVLTASIGIAVYDGEQQAYQDMLREAENAMYLAKRAGNDRIEIFKPSMRGESNERVMLESELRRAIDRGQIEIAYQPIVRLGSAELAGFEALIRWEHPRLGLLNPEKFVPIAEDMDLIVSLGRHVLERAIKETGRWQKILPRDEDPLFVSVNISSRELFRHDLVHEIRSVLRRETLPAGSLKLEITESLMMENPERAAEILQWLKEAGAGLAIDDFGTGYSSLAYLQRFTFDTVKVDRLLVQDEGLDGRGPVILRSVVALAHELNKDVIAEGVETVDDASFLRSINCEFAQGFYFGAPMSPREVVDLVKMVAKTERGADWTNLFRSARPRKPSVGQPATESAQDQHESATAPPSDTAKRPAGRLASGRAAQASAPSPIDPTAGAGRHAEADAGDRGGAPRSGPASGEGEATASLALYPGDQAESGGATDRSGPTARDAHYESAPDPGTMRQENDLRSKLAGKLRRTRQTIQGG